MPPLKTSRPYYSQTNLLPRNLLSWSLGPATGIGCTSGFRQHGDVHWGPRKSWDSVGSDWLAGLSDQTCHTCLGRWSGVLGQLSLWLSIADSWQFNFTPQVPHYLCRHLKNMWALDRITDQWQRLHGVQVAAVKVKVSMHELAVVGIHDKGSFTDKQSVRLKRTEICQWAGCRL